MDRSEKQQQAANKVTLIGALVNALLGVAKIIFGALSHSAALIADGIHSLSDLFTDFLVLLILRFSNKGPDEDHPWGHARFETVGTVILGSILIAVAGAMAYDSIHRLLEGQIQIPTWPALLVAFVSIAAKEWVYRYTLRIGTEVESDLIIANAWHSRTDALSSIVVLIGVAGAMAGLVWLDLIAALIVAGMVAKIGWNLSWDSLQQLVDTALPEAQIERYKSVVMSVDGIVNVHSFKSRSMGNKSLLEIHIQVSPFVSASEGHRIGDEAASRLKQEDKDVGHIIYHIDTYDDELTETEGSCCVLPLRNEIEPVVINFLGLHLPESELYRLNLYYEPSRIHLQILLHSEDANFLTQQTALKQTLSDMLNNPAWLGDIYLGAEHKNG